MRRRMVVLGAAAGAMLAGAGVRAQQAGRRYRVGVLMLSAGGGAGPYVFALRDQLAKHGFVEGKNLTIDVRYPEGFGARSADGPARELLALKPDGILALGTAFTEAAMARAGDTPVVFAWVADPLGSRFVKDLARPGGNVTGAANRYFELTAKRVELACELIPSAKRLAMVSGFFDAFTERLMQDAERAALRLGVELIRVESGGAWSGVIPSSIKRGAQAAIMVIPFVPFGMALSLDEVVRKSVEHRFPTIFADVEAVDGGALVSYSNSFADEIRRGANLLARVLKGEKPSELAVDQAARFELAINLGTARAIGINVPQSLLVRADRVIE